MPSEQRNSPTPLSGTGRQEDEVELGFVSGVFGLMGEVRLHLHNRDTYLRQGEWPAILVDPGTGRRFAVSLSVRPGAGKRFLGQIGGVVGREAAGQWQGWRLVVPTSDLPALAPDEFYLWQVEGLPVFCGAQQVGEVVGVHQTAGAEVFEVRVGDDTVFVPALERYVLAVDLEAGRVEIAPGALESES